MYEETHYREGPGRAKRLQLRHQAKPADLAALIAAAFPDLAEQEAAGMAPRPPDVPVWPWSQDAYPARLEEARAHLARRSSRQTSTPAASARE
jgi:hypothetical protein